jgi:hypothetical protein
LGKTKCPATEMAAGGTKKDGATMKARSTATHNPINRVLGRLSGVEKVVLAGRPAAPYPDRKAGIRNPSIYVSEGGDAPDHPAVL